MKGVVDLSLLVTSYLLKEADYHIIHIFKVPTNIKRRRSYHAVANVVDDAGNKGHATRLCCYGTRVFCGEVNRWRREGGRQLIPLGWRLCSYHGSGCGL